MHAGSELSERLGREVRGTGVDHFVCVFDRFEYEDSIKSTEGDGKDQILRNALIHRVVSEIHAEEQPIF